MSRRAAFTLVELLVVVAILSLLAALLAPTLRRAGMLGRTAVCGSNLHQMGTALQTYVAKSGWYPIGIDQHSDNVQRVWLWPPQLRVLTGTAEVMRCPQAPAGTRWKPAYGSGLPAYYGYDNDEVRIHGFSHVLSYGYNVWGANISVVPNPGLGVYKEDPRFGETKATRVVRPDDMIAFADSNLEDYWSGYIGIYRVGQFPSDIHFGNTNVLLCDGHVETTPRETLIDITDPAVNRQWNVDHQPH